MSPGTWVGHPAFDKKGTNPASQLDHTIFSELHVCWEASSLEINSLANSLVGLIEVIVSRQLGSNKIAWTYTQSGSLFSDIYYNRY
jgi:hypothetical protein